MGERAKAQVGPGDGFLGFWDPAAGTSMLVGKWHSSNIKGRTRTSGRRTAHVGLSSFRLTHVADGFWKLNAYVVELKGQK